MAGRPALDPNDPSVSITLRLPSKQLDGYCQKARRAGLAEDRTVSVPEIIRRELAKKTKNHDA
jgi:hypothetical protein